MPKPCHHEIVGAREVGQRSQGVCVHCRKVVEWQTNLPHPHKAVAYA